MTEKVQVEVKGAVATITLNKPARLNALDVEMWEGLADACRVVDAASEVRAAILMGAGGCFCAGLDVKAGSTMSPLGADVSPGAALATVTAHLGHLQSCFTAVETLRVPVIAAIQRACMGAGLELSLCCDIRLAAKGTLFSIPEVQLGLVPDMGGTQRLPRVIGIGKAKELIYSARRIDATEAARIGLVNAVYPADDLLERAGELAAEIAANAPLAVQAAKRAIDGAYARERDGGLAWEVQQAAGPLLSEDRKAGLRAAAARTRAEFKGN